MPSEFANAFEGPILGSDRSAAGGLDDKPLGLIARQEYVFYWNDFLYESDLDQTDDWTEANIGPGGSVGFLNNNDSGFIRIDIPSNNRGSILQHDRGKSGITPAAAVGGTSVASDAVMGARFSLTDVANSDIFVGLAEDSAFMTSAGALTSNNHIGFHKVVADGSDIRFTAVGTANASEQTVESIATLSNDTLVEVMVRATGTTQARGYFRAGGTGGTWSEVGDLDLTGNPWNAVMFLSFAMVGSGAGDDMDIDYCFFTKKRDLTE